MAAFIPIGTVNSIASNLAAESTARVLAENTFLLQKSLARLSSGLRIVSAGDDPAGLAAAIRAESELNRVSAAQTNVTNAQSYVETQTGFLNNVQDALDRMSELALLSSDDLTTDEQRSNYSEEFVELQSFVSTTGTKTFNGINLFSSSDFNVTVDPNGGTFSLNSLKYNETGAGGGLSEVYDTADISTAAGALTASTKLEIATDNLSFMLAKAGSHTQRLNLESGALSVHSENLTALDDSIMKVDTAAEAVRYATFQVRVDAATAMLVQANLIPNRLLELLNFS